MPCYTPKALSEDDFLTQLNLDATIHAIKYYYEKRYQCPIPEAINKSHTHWAATSSNGFEILEEAPVVKELNILHDIAHHVLCDNIQFEELYDVIQLLDISKNPTEGGYARVAKFVADIIRSEFKWTPPDLDK